MTTKVSIITPSFNGATTIEGCVNSIRAQGYKNIEHIVIDGGSTDGTLAILERLKVRYISEADAGIYDAMNKGIELATGEIVGILNCDDYYCDDKVIEDVVRYFHSTDCELCHGKIVQVDSNGRHIWSVGSEVSFNQLLKKMRVAHPSVFVRKYVYKKYGSFSIGFRIAGDYEFVLRVWNKLKIGYLDRVMVMMSMEGVSQTHAEASYRESMAAAILHGANIFQAVSGYSLGVIKHVVVVRLRALGWRRI
jgi:glycosyltransferase